MEEKWQSRSEGKRVVPHEEPCRSASRSWNGRYVLLVANEGTLRVYGGDFVTTRARRFKIRWSLVRSVSATPDKSELQLSRRLDTRAFASNFALSRSRWRRIRHWSQMRYAHELQIADICERKLKFSSRMIGITAVNDTYVDILRNEKIMF